MNYVEFKESVARYFKASGQEIVIRSTIKVNRTLDGLFIKDERVIHPMIYVNHMYDEYRMTNDFEGIMKKYQDILRNEQVPSFDFAKKLSNTKDRVFFQLISIKGNEALLEGIPHRKFLDLAIVYRWMIGDAHNVKGVQSALIHHELANDCHLSEDELYHAAYANTKRLLPLKVVGLSEAISGHPVKDEIAYMLGNQNNYCGATSMLYPENLERISNIFESDFYILPSSIHECITIPKGDESVLALAGMVKKVNEEEVALEDRLSDSVYCYHRDTKKITLA